MLPGPPLTPRNQDPISAQPGVIRHTWQRRMRLPPAALIPGWVWDRMGCGIIESLSIMNWCVKCYSSNSLQSTVESLVETKINVEKSKGL